MPTGLYSRVDIHKALGATLRALREERDLTELQVADRMNLVPRGRLYSIEEGSANVSIREADELAAAFGITLAQLFQVMESSCGKEKDSASTG